MSYKFEIPNISKSIIKVVGVGGGGSNAVNYMYNQGIVGVEFIVCNTDAQALKASPIPNKLPLGSVGLGAGSIPDKAKQFAIDDKEKIREALDGTKMLFITAGMGGGTGTGAAPVIAKIARDMDILTVGIVTMPFTFEGNRKKEVATKGIEELRLNCDAVLVILNDKLYQVYPNLNFKQAFSQADIILSQAAKSIAEIIGDAGFINIDLEDVNTVMKNAGTALMGFGVASGESRAERAADLALHSPLLNNTDITGATKILVSITADEDTFQMDEFEKINTYFQDKAEGDAFLKPGVRLVKNFGEEISVTVIATGFEETAKSYMETKTKIDLDSSNRQTSIFDHNSQPVKPIFTAKTSLQEEEQKVIEPSMGVFAKIDAKEKIILEMDGQKGGVKQPDLFGGNQGKPSLNNYQDLNQEKKEKLNQDYVVRTRNLSQISTVSSLTPEELKEKFEIPAYLRNGTQLHEPQHSSEKSISRYSLNEDNEILGNNKFLHDNVD